MTTASAWTHLKILVVDDRPSVCEIVSRFLARFGARNVETTITGAEALRRLATATHPFDVAIFDIDMPADDGLVCIRKLATFDHKPAVILMSGKDPLVLDSALRLGLSLGVTVLGALQKPVTSQELAALLDTFNGVSGVVKRSPAAKLTAAELAVAFGQERFEVWFQPQYSLTARRVIGVEGLLRLNHAERGLVAPDAFIQPAEDSGLIVQLTDFVLEQAARWCAAWNAQDHALTVSVNLSKAGLQDLTLPDRAAAICARHGIATQQITLELTESTFATDQAAVLDITSRLRLKGFRLSLDDFGTGFASLEELRLVPFHELKLDKQFVQSATDNPRSRAILEGSIGLARDLNMTTVAEGVETEATVKLVEALGCDVAQGFFFSRPMPADSLLAWLDRFKEETGFVQAGATQPEPGGELSAAVQFQSPASEPLTGEAVSRFTHDAASPLMMVLALSEMLLDDQSVAPHHRVDIQQIHDASREVTTMLKALQTRARASEGRIRNTHSTSRPVSAGKT